ncbi:MAG: FAD:protein FMN transferase [Prevotellaceae bacterium]|nr:FAD:protein FMN transferase [Prevotellaceae bacterium]
MGTLLSGCTGSTVNDSKNYFIINGFAQGTYYRITYHDRKRRNFQPEIEKLLQEFERSLSVYDSTSIISRVNRNEDVEVDDYFIELFNRAAEISRETNGAFDISGEPLYLAWGFSRKNKIPMDAHKVDSLKHYVGMDKIKLEDRQVVKTNPNVVLNGNAIAKGYSTDVVARFLESKGCKDYLVDIGGEMHMKGKSTKGRDWRIGIDSPIDGNFEPGAEVQVILEVSNKGLATSGNYRRFYIENGKKIGHTINPVTGYPTNHNLLSCTVIADDCLTADAFATAFLVVGLDSAKRWIEKFSGLEVYFIYDDNGEFKTDYTKGMERHIVRTKKEQTP